MKDKALHILGPNNLPTLISCCSSPNTSSSNRTKFKFQAGKSTDSTDLWELPRPSVEHWEALLWPTGPSSRALEVGDGLRSCELMSCYLMFPRCHMGFHNFMPLKALLQPTGRLLPTLPTSLIPSHLSRLNIIISFREASLIPFQPLSFASSMSGFLSMM